MLGLFGRVHTRAHVRTRPHAPSTRSRAPSTLIRARAQQLVGLLDAIIRNLTASVSLSGARGRRTGTGGGRGSGEGRGESVAVERGGAGRGGGGEGRGEGVAVAGAALGRHSLGRSHGLGRASAGSRTGPGRHEPVRALTGSDGRARTLRPEPVRACRRRRHAESRGLLRSRGARAFEPLPRRLPFGRLGTGQDGTGDRECWSGPARRRACSVL